MRAPNFTRKQQVWLIASAVVLLALLIVAVVYRRFLFSAWDIIAQGTGGRTTAALCVLGALLVLLWLLVWVLFPLIVYLSLRDLRRRTAALDETTRACVNQLARLSK